MRWNASPLLSLVIAAGLPVGANATLGLVRPCDGGLIDVCLHNGCPGTRVCIAGLVSVCLPPVERCDGADDDCDGSVDEDFAGLGEACGVGEGACAREGVVVCDATGEGGACGAVAGAPIAEGCNGVDDDCDGAVDEGEAGGLMTEACYEGPEDTEGVGPCVGGVRTCVDGAFGACEGQVTPSEEVCDDIDDDCDGDVYGGCSGCALVRALDPTAEDGEYLLPLGGDPAQEAMVYCHDMEGEPRAYLTLVNVGPDENFSQYTAAPAAPGASVRTRFERVRFDVDTLVVDGADLTFATSSGALQHAGRPVVSMPYGVAMACDYQRAGIGNVDLRGTPFAAVGDGCLAGYDVAGDVSISEAGQVIDFTAVGYCGWATITPNCGIEPQFGGAGYTMQLRLLDDAP